MSVRAAYILTLVLVLGSLLAFTVIGAEARSYIVLALVLCVLLMAGLLYRPIRWLSCGVTLLLVGGGYLLLRPVCVLIPDEALANFTPLPIEQRTDRSGYMPMFQQKADGHWYQCQMAIDRWFFF
jgi:hypothetical protein